MQRSGTIYTFVFAAAVCAVCSAMVCGAAYALRARQDANVLLDKQLQVLNVGALLEGGERLTAAAAQELFDANIEVRLVDLASGDYADDALTDGFDMVRAAKDPELGGGAPQNNAGVSQMPKYATVSHVMKDGEVDMLILQVWGRGLWSTMYGYLALDKDCKTIRGLTFYDQGETPGLGGEVDNPRWKAHWQGRIAFDDSGAPAIVMRKGGAGPADEDPHGFDGLSGATITSRGVENLLNYWLSASGYQPFLEKFQQQQS